MSKSNRWFLGMIMVVAILSSASALLAIDDTATRSTLRGLEGVYIKIDNIDFESRKADVDVIIKPNLAHISPLDFCRAEECIKEGERDSDAVLGQINKLRVPISKSEKKN